MVVNKVYDMNRNLNQCIIFRAFLTGIFFMLSQTAISVPQEPTLATSNARSAGKLTLESVLEEIRSRHGLVLIYQSKHLKDKYVDPDINITGHPGKVLSEILNTAGLRLKKIDNNIYSIYNDPGLKTPLPGVPSGRVQVAAVAPATTQRSISGKVTDAEGNPLPGITVLEKGTDNGTATDIDGNYTLTVNAEAVLVFSFIGFVTQEIPVENASVIDVTMAMDIAELEDVVVIGYGTQRREDVTGSVGTVSLNKVKDQAITGADQLITGQISGVQLSQPAGVPGGGPTIQIRGVGAVGAGSEPLYVVDGFPIPQSSAVISNPLNNIPPQDIESISVLKDASAAAIYGSRGANGVILIKTKQGSSGEARVQVNLSSGIQQIMDRTKPDLMNAREFAQWRKEAIEDEIRSQGREPAPEDIPEDYRNPEQYGAGTDWYKEITQAAFMHDLNVSIQGGSDKMQSYVSAGFLQQDGVVLGTDYNRFSLRANINAQLSDKIRAGVSLSPTYSVQNSVAVGGAGRSEAGFGTALVASPLVPVYDENGEYTPMIASTNTFNYPNPIMELLERSAKTRRFNGLASGFIEYDLLPGLNLRTSLNVQYTDNEGESFHPSTVGRLNQAPPIIPFSGFDVASSINWASETNLNYSKEFGDGHVLKGLLGFSLQENKANNGNFSGEDYPDDAVRTLNAATRILGSTVHSDWSLMSYLARVNYDFKRKYLLTATVRWDGSSRFGADNRWGMFPSAAVGWRLSEEDFMKDVDWLSELKLRASYGNTGNFNIGNYTHLSMIATSDYVLGSGRASGRVVNSLGNIGLGWEKTREINFGLDVGIFQHRYNFHLEYYVSNTEDLLLNVEIPHSSGFSNVTENRGDVENRGLELSLEGTLVQTKAVNWAANFNIAFNRNKVLRLGRDNAPIYAGFGGGGVESNITMVGQPIGMFYGWALDGLYANEEDVASSPTYPGALPGNLKMKDINGDGILTAPQDFAIIGNPYPDFTWGFTNTLSFKNFDARILIAGSQGADRYRQDHHYYHNTDGVFNVSRDQINRWRSESDPGDGKTPRAAGATSRRYYRMINSGAIENSSFVWIKNITLGYSFALSQLNTDLRVYSSIQNAWLLTSYGGSNPDATSYNQLSGQGALAPGSDFVTYPVPRIISLGVQFDF